MNQPGVYGFAFQAKSSTTSLVFFSGNPTTTTASFVLTLDDIKVSVKPYYIAEVMNASTYYPFGMEMPNRSYQPDDYRYSFNGKEMVREWGRQDYGMRDYNPLICRFDTPDPLAKKYPELTSYQFASNTPIQAIDLDGLEAFFIHGTASDNTRWTNAVVNTILRITNDKTYNTGFNWNNDPLYNTERMRGVAAKKLAAYVIAHRVAGEEITLIGHSHGGNVAIQAAKIIHQQTGERVNIITIATPAYNGKGDVENPETQKEHINDHIALWNKVDGVSGGLAGDDYYTNSTKTQNVEINVDQYYTGEITGNMGNKFKTENNMGAHSFDVEHPEAINEAITAGKIRALKPVVKQASPVCDHPQPQGSSTSKKASK